MLDNDTQGGELSIERYFSGEIGIFGGFEYYIPHLRGARFKVEYDSTDYLSEGFPLGKESLDSLLNLLNNHHQELIMA